MYYMGIDHHKQFSHMTIMDEKGKVIKGGRVINRRKDVEEFISGYDNQLEAVIETGRSSYTMVDMLEEMGVGVKIAHPYEIKAIAKARIKTDKRDSTTLAHLLRTNYIPEVHRRQASNRQRQRVLRHRMSYIGIQTQVKNRIRVLLAQQREEVRDMAVAGRKLFTAERRQALRELDLAGKDKELICSLLDTLEHVQEQVKKSDALVKELYKDNEQARLISTIPGFGVFFSVLIATEIETMDRFSSEAHLHSYAGVIPSTRSTADKTYHGRLIKQGNKWLRWALIEAVWPAMQSDFDIRLFYQRHARRKGANRARVATARRLLTIIYRVLKDKRSYIPYKRDKNSAAL